MAHRSHRDDGAQARDESGSTGPGRRSKHAPNLGKLKLGNRKRCSERSTHQGATRKLDSQTSRVEEVCLENACMHDVHVTGPLPPTHSTTTKGWRSAPDAILPGHRRAPHWVPARTPTVHWGPNNGEAVGGPHQRPKGEVHMP